MIIAPTSFHASNLATLKFPSISFHIFTSQGPDQSRCALPFHSVVEALYLLHSARSLPLLLTADKAVRNTPLSKYTSTPHIRSPLILRAVLRRWSHLRLRETRVSASVIIFPSVEYKRRGKNK